MPKLLLSTNALIVNIEHNATISAGTDPKIV